MPDTRYTFEQVTSEIRTLIGARVAVMRGESTLAMAGPDGFVSGESILIPWTFNGDELAIVVQPESALPEHLVAGVVRLVIQQLTVTSRLSDRSHAKDRFIADLLTGPVPEHYDITRVGEVLSIDITRPRSVLLIDASELTRNSDDATARAHDVMSSIAQFFCIANETICGYLGAGRIAVLKATASQDLRRWSRVAAHLASPAWADLEALKSAAADLRSHLQRDFRCHFDIAVGRYHPDVAGLRSSYEDCRLALQLGRFRGVHGVHCLDELGITALLGATDESMRLSLAERLLAPLTDVELLATLQAFFECDCSPTETARLLNIHRNTLTYRLDKIGLLTGLSPRAFGDAIQLRAALEIRRIATCIEHK